MANCTYIDGIGSSQAIDTAGEVVDIQGLDCSSLEGAAFNYEHKSDIPAQIVGKVLEFKKIYSEKDCDTERHKHFWSKCKIPFLYVLGRLFDDKKDSSKEVAALFLDDAENPHEKPMIGFSIEGAKIDKQGMVITRSIARKVTLTNLPANKTCVAEMLPKNQEAPVDSIASLFKTEPTEIEFFKPNSKYLEFLEKKEKDMKKDDLLSGGSLAVSEMEKAQVPGSKYPPAAQVSPTSVRTQSGVSPNPKPAPIVKSEMSKSAPSWSAGKKSGDAVHFSHPEHGTVSIHKQPGGDFHVKHQGKLAGMGGIKGTFATAGEAGKHAKNYMGAIGSKKTLAPQMHDRPSPSMIGKSDINKAMTAGGGNVAPSQLEGGAALAKEHLDKSVPNFGKFNAKPKKSSGASQGSSQTSMTSVSSMSVGGGMGGMGGFGKSEKSALLKRAEEAYDKWEKKENFRQFMAKNMPHLAKGEVDAIGQTIALKKSMEAEGKLSKMLGSYYGKAEKKK